jgi:DNA repair photolyase
MPTKFLSTSSLANSRDVAQLQPLVARRVDEIAVTVVDDDEVKLGIEARAPQLSGRLRYV